MKKVLIIGHFWPYHLGGSKRVYGLAKYVPEFGWEPIILTGFLKEKPDFKIRTIETSSSNVIASLKRRLHLNPNKGFQGQIGIPSVIREGKRSFTSKIIRLIEGIITYPDVEKEWKPFALRAAEEFLKTEKIDAMISISPIPAHLIAKELKNEYRLPWIADFPDLWSENCCYSYGLLRKFFDRRLEKKTLKLADFLTTSSWPQARVLEKLHKREIVHTIMIGYDPEKANDSAAKLKEKFTITYTGLWQGRERDPLKLFIALSELISKRLINPSDIEVRFYGPKQEWIEREIKKYGLSNIVKQYGVIPWEECLKKQRESQLLLQLNWGDKKEKGIFSGKFPEYLAARRPIVAVGGFGQDAVVKEMLFETKAGVYCPQLENIKNYLLKFYLEYKQKGKVSYQGDIKTINKYSYREMARKFAEVLNSPTIENKIC